MTERPTHNDLRLYEAGVSEDPLGSTHNNLALVQSYLDVLRVSRNLAPGDPFEIAAQSLPDEYGRTTLIRVVSAEDGSVSVGFGEGEDRKVLSIYLHTSDENPPEKIKDDRLTAATIKDALFDVVQRSERGEVV